MGDTKEDTDIEDRLFQIDRESLLSMFVNDFDLTSAYPLFSVAFNIEKETMLYSVYEIENKLKSDIYDFFSCIMAKKENAVYLGKKYFNLPDYTEMLDLVKKSLL